MSGIIEAQGLKLQPAAYLPLPRPRPNFTEFCDTAHCIFLNQRIGTSSTEYMLRECWKAKSHKRVVIVVNSTGGNINYALQIYLAIQELIANGTEVRMVTDEFCQSAALPVLLAAPPNCRYGTRRTIFVVHSTGFVDMYGRKVTEYSPAQKQEIEETNENFFMKIILRGSRVSRQSLHRALSSGEDITFGTAEALALGIISGQINRTAF